MPSRRESLCRFVRVGQTALTMAPPAPHQVYPSFQAITAAVALFIAVIMLTVVVGPRIIARRQHESPMDRAAAVGAAPSVLRSSVVAELGSAAMQKSGGSEVNHVLIHRAREISGQQASLSCLRQQPRTQGHSSLLSRCGGAQAGFVACALAAC